MRFEPFGPYPIPCSAHAGINPSLIKDLQFWESTEEWVPDAIGIYVFFMRNRGFMPWYVGKATKSFKQEALHADKLAKYNDAIHLAPHGTPCLMFFAKLTAGGTLSFNDARIDQLEDLMIGAAVQKNPDLINVKKTMLYREMVVPGLLNTPNGRPTASVQAVRKLFA
jgi:hypothetical protein